jgi:hypothetical protein
MSDLVAAPVILVISSVIFFVLGYLIRVRGPRGLINAVDWDRVSDMYALGRYASNLLFSMGLAMIGFGLAVYLTGDDKSSRNIAGVCFAALITLLSLALVIGILRYQDKSTAIKRDGRR